jgi:2-polyprenyl-3-methyl-5-hydroxy-6-metoxy-1,4-benzoquinol methylase
MDISPNVVRNQLGYYEILPKPSAEYLQAYYNSKYYGTEKINNQYNYTYTEEEVSHKRIDPAEALTYTGDRCGCLFEIGFGEGFFLDYFDRQGWKIDGVDFTIDGLKSYHPHLVGRVSAGDVFEAIEGLAARSNKFDLVVCNNVLEHVIDPVHLLQQLRQLLLPSGVARIVVPNDGSWLQHEIVDRKLAESDYWVCPPDHLNYFNVQSFVAILENAGLKVIDLLGTFPIDLFLLNPSSNYQQQPNNGRNCHFARVAFENSLWQRSASNAIEFRRGCGRAGIGRDLVAYCQLQG